MTPREELLAAAQVIRERGWFKHYPLARGRVCLVTSLGDRSDKAYQYLREVTCVSVITFNDYHCETADDAIAALEIAADLAA